MHRRTIVAAAVVAAAVVIPATAQAGTHAGPKGDWTRAETRHGSGFTFGVIGDTPYGDAMIKRFPQDVARINSDTSLQALVHVGDIKSGSTKCTDEYNAWVKSQFDRFTMPLVYTPGDNEWTDCHRANNGGYNPLERLAAIRNTFFATPGLTLGAPYRVKTQVNAGVPENVSTIKAGVSFSTLHVVGSNDGLAPWTGAKTPNTAQIADQKVRMNAAIAQVRRAYADARRHQLTGVVLFQQADMFDDYDGWKLGENDAFLPLIKVIAEESNRFKGATYLINGDSHEFTDDHPLAAGSPWLTRYGLTTCAPRLHRITVNGSSDANEYLRFSVNDVKRGDQNLLSMTHVPLVG